MRLRCLICAAPVFFVEPADLELKAYTPAFVQSQLDLLKRQKKFTEKITLVQDEIDKEKQSDVPGQGEPDPSKDPSQEPSKDPGKEPDPAPGQPPVNPAVPSTSGPSTRSKDPKTGRIKKSGVAAGAIMPPKYEKQRKFRGGADKYSLKNASELLRLGEYLHMNGSYEICPTPKDGDCLYSAVKWGCDFPQEYSSDMMKRQLIVTMCENPDFFLQYLYDGIAGEYGGVRLSKEKYEQKRKDNELTPDQIHDYSAPGPFSFCEWLEYIWQDGTWGDESVITALSLQWQLCTTVLNAEKLYEVRMRHDRPLEDVDLVVVHCGRNHYVGACKYFCFYSFSFTGNLVSCGSGRISCGSQLRSVRILWANGAALKIVVTVHFSPVYMYILSVWVRICAVRAAPSVEPCGSFT